MWLWHELRIAIAELNAWDFLGYWDVENREFFRMTTPTRNFLESRPSPIAKFTFVHVIRAIGCCVGIECVKKKKLLFQRANILTDSDRRFIFFLEAFI